MKTTQNGYAPGMLAGAPGPSVLTDSTQTMYCAQNTKSNPIIRVTSEIAEAIRKSHPIEGLILDICLKNGKAVIVESGEFK